MLELEVIEAEEEEERIIRPSAATSEYNNVSTVIGIAVGAILFVIVGTSECMRPAMKSHIAGLFVIIIIDYLLKLVGLGAFIYHDRYSNKPRALEDYANSDSGSGGGNSGYFSVEDSVRRVSQVECIGFDIPRVSRLSKHHTIR
jgi:hypothetical protein